MGPRASARRNQVGDRRTGQDRLVGIGGRPQRLRWRRLVCPGRSRSGPACGRRVALESMNARSDPARSMPRATASAVKPRCSASSRSRICRMPGLHARIAASLDREVAFRVHAHRPPREVRRSDAHQLVVDDHHLRVDEGRHVLRARRRRIDEPQTLVRVGGDHSPEHAVAKRAHRVLLEPAVAFLRRDDDDLGPVGSFSRAASASASVVVGEVLALDVDRMLRRAQSNRERAPRTRGSPAACPNSGTVRAIATSTSVRSGVTSDGQRSLVDGRRAAASASRPARASDRAPARQGSPQPGPSPSPGLRDTARRALPADVRAGSSTRCALVSQRWLVRSMPPQKASWSSTTMTF